MGTEKRILLLTQTGYSRFQDAIRSSRLTRPIAEVGINKMLRDNTFGAIPHYGAGILAAEARACGYKVDIESLNNPHVLHSVDDYRLVIVSAMDIGIERVKDLADQFKDKPNLVVGGIGPTFAINEFRSKFPRLTIVCGEGEGLVQKFIHDFETQGQMAPTYTRANPVNLADCEQEPYMQSEYDFRQLSHFKKAFVKPLEVSRGCSQGCEFCVTARQPISIKPIEATKQEILRAGLKNYRHILAFVDQNLFSCPQDYLQELFDFINYHGLYWAGEGTILEGLENHKLMQTMAKNCLGFLVGIEDMFNPAKGSPIKNRFRQDFQEYVRSLRHYRIPILYSMIFGTDDQTSDIFQSSAETVLDLGITPVSHIATPRIGTPFFERVVREQRLIDEDSRHRDMKHFVVHIPKRMTPEQLLSGFIYFDNVVFSRKEIIRRFIKNLPDYNLHSALALSFLDAVSMYDARYLANMYPELFLKGKNRI